jgi:hypothetical protein
MVEPEATDDNIAHAHYMLGNKGYRHKLRIYNTYSLFTTTMVERTRLFATLYGMYIDSPVLIIEFCSFNTSDRECVVVFLGFLQTFL